MADSMNAPTAIETLILRFRDLVTTPGDTLKKHTELAAAGSVWWGWWRKAGEIPPQAVFGQLQKRMASGVALEILLFDSGRLEISRVTCKKIDWSQDETTKPSPDKMRTPAYYSEQSYLAWFEFTKFDAPLAGADAQKLLQEYSYFRIDEFFEHGMSRYTPFYGKRVHDCEELREQDRTIWFVRKFKSGDPTHKVSLLSSRTLQPSHFPRDFMPSDSAHLLWLSDIHVGQHHSFPEQSTPQKKALSLAIENAAKEHNLSSFGGVIISGDITWKGVRSEFEAARTCFGSIISPYKLDNYQYAICPGNHDLCFTDSPSNQGPASTDKAVSDSAKTEYSRFYEQLFYVAPNKHLSLGRRYLLGGCVPVEVVCLNSSTLEQKKNFFQGVGFVGEDQLENAASEFGWVQGGPEAGARTRPFRIVVLHHHLMPVTHSHDAIGGISNSIVLDATAVIRWLCKHRVDLVLHGHMHESFCARVSEPIEPEHPEREWHTFQIIGLGSSGVEKDHRGEVPNMFGVLTAIDSGMNVTLYTISPKEPSKIYREINVPAGSIKS